MSRMIRTVAATLAVLAVAPASAMADRYLVAPNALTATTSTGTASPNSTPSNGTFQCSVAWATVANKPSGYAIGNCANTVHLHRTTKSDPTDTGYYDGGEIFGNYAGCGWIGVNADSAFNTTDQWSNCSPVAGYDEPTFQASSDGCSGTSSCAGTPRDNPSTCNEYGNFRPWLSGQSVSDSMNRGIPAHTYYTDANGYNAPRLAYRYVAKYAANSGIRYAMVRDRAVATGSGNWVFVNANCMGV